MAPRDVRKKLDPWSGQLGSGKVDSRRNDSWSEWGPPTTATPGGITRRKDGRTVNQPNPWDTPPLPQAPDPDPWTTPPLPQAPNPDPWDTPPLPQNPDPNKQPLPQQRRANQPIPRTWGNSNWNQFELWQPGQQVGGWDPNFKVDVPSGTDENAIQAAHFLNWINQVMPMMSPADISNVMQQLTMSLDALDNEAATEYFRKLAKNASTMGMDDTSANMWDRDRLRELRRATNAYFLGQEGGGLEDLDEGERYAQDMINLLDMLVGVEDPSSGISNPGIWDDDNPMSRRERRQFWDKVNTYAGGIDENDPFGNILMTLLNPTTSNPMLNSYINMPDRSLYGGRGTQRAYGWQNPRYT